MIPIQEAVALVLEQSAVLPTVRIGLQEAVGHVLAEPVLSPLDVPPFDRAMMDGFAVRADDLSESGVELPVVGEVHAGGLFEGTLEPGQAVRIMTGAPVPAGADCVVRVEDTDPVGKQAVRIAGRFAAEMAIQRQGSLIARDAEALCAGHRVRPQELALLAELGWSEVKVHRRPTVAVLATGDELVRFDEVPGRGQIRNSNEPMLVAQLTGWGCQAVGLGIARDNEAELIDAISRGLEHDILILTGGVSMGAKDLVPTVLASCGARQIFHKVELKPGKPMWFGIRDPREPGAQRSLIFALPGNPVSSMVCSELFVRPATRRLAGIEPALRPRRTARLTTTCSLKDGRTTCFPASINTDGSDWEVTPAPWRGSADLRATTDANGMILFPAGGGVHEAGSQVEVVPWWNEE